MVDADFVENQRLYSSRDGQPLCVCVCRGGGLEKRILVMMSKACVLCFSARTGCKKLTADVLVLFDRSQKHTQNPL